MNKKKFGFFAGVIFLTAVIISAFSCTFLSKAAGTNTSYVIGDDGYSSDNVGAAVFTGGKDYELVIDSSKGSKLKVKCINYDPDTKKAIFMTYGFASTTWPGRRDLTSNYSSKFGEMAPAVSDLRLPCCDQSDVDSSYEGLYINGAEGKMETIWIEDTIVEARTNLRIEYVWLGNNASGGHVFCTRGDGLYYPSQSTSTFGVAPGFTLDTSLVRISGKQVYYGAFQESNAISYVKNVNEINEGDVFDLTRLISDVKYANGSNKGKSAAYTLTVDEAYGKIEGTKWTVCNDIDDPVNVSIRVKSYCGNCSTGINVTLIPKEEEPEPEPEPEPVDPEPTDTEPTYPEPEPIEWEPVELDPIDSEVTDPDPTNSEPTEPAQVSEEQKRAEEIREAAKEEARLIVEEETKRLEEEKKTVEEDKKEIIADRKKLEEDRKAFEEEKKAVEEKVKEERLDAFETISKDEINATGVYRLYNPNSGLRHFTTDYEEMMNLLSLGWGYEGIAFYVYKTGTGGTPVYRSYDHSTGAHYYTTDRLAHLYNIALGMQDEGIAWEV